MRNATFAMLLATAACTSEPGIRNLVPVIAVAPEAVFFGDVGPPLTETQQVFVENSGGADLEISEIATAGGANAFQLDVAAPLVLGPGEELALDVTFAPRTFTDYTGQLVITSNDKERDRVSVKLTGRGVDLPFPDIEIRPSQTVAPDYDGLVPIGESAVMTFEIWNVGDADLNLGTIAVDLPQFTEITAYGQSGARVPPDQFVSMFYVYTPDDAGGHLGQVTIPSDDPDEPETIVQLNGNEGIELPVAVINCPDEVLLTGPEYVDLSGAASFDPAGFEPLLYSWTVTGKPAASDPDILLDPSDTEEIELYVDVAGQWTIELRVLNTLGAMSHPAVCTFMAIPEDDLHVELSWDTTASDLDLHLVQSGFQLFDTPEDICWCNRTPDWGAAGDDDDPRLDIDDVAGIGPENINILHPADGDYDVRVQYYQTHGDGPSIATVHVWLDGVEVYTGSQALSSDEEWFVGTAHWSAADFTPIGTVVDASRFVCE